MLFNNRVIEFLRMLLYIRFWFPGVLKCVLHASPYTSRDPGDTARTQRSLCYDAAKRDRQAGKLLPPCPKVYHLVQTGLLIGEAAFVDDKAGVNVAISHGVCYEMKGHDGYPITQGRIK